MGFILGFLLIILVIGLFFVAIVFGFLRSIFRFGGRKRQQPNPQDFEPTQQNSKTKKIFEKNEGEYVDYEEI